MKYFKSTFKEMKKVKWPTYKQNRLDTATVVIYSLAFAIFLGELDELFSLIMQHL